MKKKMSFVMAGMMAVSSMSLGSVATFAEEPYTVKIVCVGDATTEACEEVSKAVSEITMEKYGVNVELVRLSYGSFQQEVNLMLASGEKLDLFPNFSFTTMSASATGQIIPLDDLLAEYGQDILDIVPEEDWGVETFGGQIYAVPNGKEHAEGFGFVCRTDMLEALDYDIDSIKTDEDVEGLLAAVKEKYPDVYPLVSDNGQMNYYMGHKDDLGGDFGVLVDCIEENYTVENWYESDEFYKLAERRYNWAQAGYIMPDAETNTQNAYDLIGAGKAFGYYGNTKPGIESEWARKAGVDMTKIEIASPYRTSSTGMNCWFIAHNSEQPDKAMMVLNEMRCNPEVSELVINGIEGEHYVKKGDVLTYPDGVDASNTTYSSAGWVWPNEFISTPWEADGPDIWKDTEEFNDIALMSVAFGFNWNSEDVMTEITACSNVKAKYENALFCGALDPATTIPKFVEELKDAGVDDIIAEKQRQLDEWRSEQN